VKLKSEGIPALIFGIAIVFIIFGALIEKFSTPIPGALSLLVSGALLVCGVVTGQNLEDDD